MINWDKRSSDHHLLLVMLALLVARSGLVDFGNKALPHVNDLPVHLVACVHALGHELEARFIQLPHPGPMPGYGTCSVGILLHLFVVWSMMAEASSTRESFFMLPQTL